MELALTFGSFGDLLALGILVKDIIVCLDDCRGSSKEYQDLVQSLTILGSAIQEIDLIFRGPRRITAAPGLCESALKSIAQIQQTLECFNEKLQKFRPSLTPGGSGNRIKDVARKIQFKMDEKELARFKGEVTGYTLALRMLMEAITLHSLDRNHDEVIEAIAATGNETRQENKRELESTRRTLMSCVTGVGRQLLEKVASLTQTTLEIRQSASQIASAVLSLSLELSSFRLLLTSFQQRAPEDRYYFIIQDAIGREFPIHLNTITSWDAFSFVLSEKFRGARGARRVRKKRYRLIEHATRREIDQSRAWENAFLPHQRIVMSLLCKDAEAQAEHETPSSNLATCPWCKTQSDSDTSTQVQCQSCNMFFSRVVELEDMVRPPQLSTGWKAPEFGRVSFDVQLPPDWARTKKRGRHDDDYCESAQKRLKYDMFGNRKRNRDEDDNLDPESDDEDVNGLVRVTLVSRRKKIKVFQMPKQGPSTSYFQQPTPPALANFMDPRRLIGDEFVRQGEPLQRRTFSWRRDALYFSAVDSESSGDGQDTDDGQDTEDDPGTCEGQVMDDDLDIDDGQATDDGHDDDPTDEDESLSTVQRAKPIPINFICFDPDFVIKEYFHNQETLGTIIGLANRSRPDYQYNRIRHITWQLFRTVESLHQPLKLGTKSKNPQFSWTETKYPHPNSRNMEYPAPEQLLGFELKFSAHSEAADMWSVGCIIVDLLLLAQAGISDSLGSERPGPSVYSLLDSWLAYMSIWQSWRRCAAPSLDGS